MNKPIPSLQPCLHQGSFSDECGPILSRGCCKRCYQKIYANVTKKQKRLKLEDAKSIWKELEESGVVLKTKARDQTKPFLPVGFNE